MVVDVFLLLILLVCILSGYRKGLLVSLCSLLILAISGLGAAAAQQAMSPKLAQRLQPELSSYIEERLEEAFSNSTSDALEDTDQTGIAIGGQTATVEDLIGLLNGLGLDVQEAAQNTAERAAEPVIASVSDGIAGVLAEPLAGVLVFGAAFLLLWLLLRGFSLALNLVDRLPVVHTLNHTGGALVGGITGAILLTLLIRILVQSGFFPENTFSGPVAKLLSQITENIF